MGIKVYHQCGHNTNWNIASFEDGVGDGLILSPVHAKMSTIERKKAKIKEHSVFDPQYYLPNSQKVKLKSYPFFPETISDGFATQDFPMNATESARQCMEFQIEQSFESLIIPARFFDQLESDYCSRQEVYSVTPFLNALSETKFNKPVFLTLPMTSHMIEREAYRTMLLNWVTKYPQVDGVYIIVKHERNSKQVQSSEFLKAYLDFITELRNADLEVLVGFSNTESLLFSLIDEITVTFGAFENTRMFSEDMYIVSDEERRGPKPRIYLPGLLNWILFSQAKEIMTERPDIWKNIYSPTPEGDLKLKQPTEPHFTQPQLYKHSFKCLYDQFKVLNGQESQGRYELLKHWIETAMANYKEIYSMPMSIEKHGNDEHLQPWLDSINYYYRAHLKG